jgi:hypothetical protein
MLPMSRPPTSSSGFQFWVAVAVLAAVTGFVLWDAAVRVRHVLAVTASYGVTVDNPATVPASPTGYADGRRSLVMPLGAADTAHWIMQTQMMLASGEWRVRRVDYDNAPDGREVHWAAPFHWWLAGLAWIDHGLTGRPLGQSVERAVIYSGPVMLGLLLAGLLPFLWRRFSVLAAVLCALGIVAVYPFYLDFAAGYADHHGLVNICGLLTVLFLAAGAQEETAAGARRWFALSGLAGGAGLWISAATQTPVLLGLGLGALVAGWLARGATVRPVWLNDPSLFRFWGLVGGGVSVAVWLLEYFPNHLGLRLEVNHPLYAAAWIGGGEVMRVALLALRDGPRALSGRDRVAGAVGVVLVALLPVIIALSAAKTFLVADSFLWRLHSQYIAEFQGLDRILRRGFNWVLAGLWLPMLLLVPALWRALRRSTSAAERASLALVLVPALLAWLMGWNQVRWLSLAFALTVPVLAVFFRADEAARARAVFLGWLAAGVLLFGSGLVKAVQRTLDAPEFTTEDIRSLAERDVAHWLRLRGGPDRVVVAATPSVTTKLIYHGGITGVDTLYWENLAGLKRAAELFAAPTPEAAREIAARLGVTHIVFQSWGAFETTLVRLQRGLPEEAPLPADTFAARLLAAPVPPAWLRAVPFKLPKHPALEGEQVRIWEITPEQTPAAAAARAANYYLELGQLDQAEELAATLVRFEDQLAPMVMLAAIASRDNDREGFAAVFGRVLANLPQAPALALDEHVHLVVVLTVGGRPELAKAQLRSAMAKVDERSLRQLSLGTLTDLLALSDGLKVALPTPELQRQAENLLPPKQDR